MNTTPKGKRVTLHDLAQRTGYTVNTVSRALKDKSDISQATREYIQSVANEMGYIRNVMASSLRSGRTKTLGVILGGMSNPYYGVMADAIQNAATEHGYSLLIQCSRDNPDLELQAAEAAISRQADGVLLFPSNQAQRTIDRMRAVGMPFILMARQPGPGMADSVLCNEELGAYLATRHLIDAGRRKLAFLSSFDVNFSSPHRKSGFERACAESSVECFSAICSGNDDIFRQLLTWKEQGVDGLFVFCDVEAWNVIKLLQEHGIAPQTMGITGFDNIQGTLPFPSPLCSIDYNLEGMAQTGIDLLRKRIHGDDSPAKTVIFEPHVVCRGSCGKA